MSEVQKRQLQFGLVPVGIDDPSAATTAAPSRDRKLRPC